MGSLSQFPSLICPAPRAGPLCPWPGCQIHLRGLSNWHGTLNPSTPGTFLTPSREGGRKFGVKPRYPAAVPPQGEGASLVLTPLPGDRVLPPAPSTSSASLPLRSDASAQLSSPQPAEVAQGTHGCLVLCLFVWIQLPAALPPWPSVTNKKRSFLSSL